jgi:hypothetical protein
MVRFLNLVAAEPEIARIPVMVDSSRWEVTRGRAPLPPGKGGRELDLAQGRREAFREGSGLVRRYGAAVVVMAFDEEGQADTVERKVEICGAPTASSRRRWAFLRRTSSSTRTSSPSPPESRSTTATGWPSSMRCGEIKAELPHALTSGGHLEPLVLLPWEPRGPRGAARGLPLPRHPGRAGHGDRERGALPVWTRSPGRAPGSCRGPPLPCAAPTPPNG